MNINSSPGFFVTGTDTGVGKTVVTAALCLACKSAGMQVSPMKPVQSGAEKGPHGLQAPDLQFVTELMDIKTRPDMCPYMLEDPCSPHLAAKRASIHLELPRIIRAYETLRASYTTLMVEGAGGIMVPLNEHDTMLDLMKALGLPIVLTARPNLGSINHTLLSLACLRNAGLILAGVVLVDTLDTPRGYIEQDNPVAIHTFGKVPVLGYIPFFEQLNVPASARVFLAEQGDKILRSMTT
jgi:dethiobiotin synthetase